MPTIDLREYSRPIKSNVDFDAPYVCPDCVSGYKGLFLINNSIQGIRIYVCPCCGCLQTVNEVERQLGKEN